jgi:hypothetical protein
MAGRAAVAAGPPAVIKQDNVSSIRQLGDEARRDRMTAPIAVVEVSEGQQTSDGSETEIVPASAATSPCRTTSAASPIRRHQRDFRVRLGPAGSIYCFS